MSLLRDMLAAGALAAACIATPAAALADRIVTYTIDPTHTQVRFSWVHVGFSTPAAVFTEVNGSITGNHDHPEKSSVEVSMPVKSLDSFVPALNDHLINSGDYFKTAEYPQVTFRSTGLRNGNKARGTFQLLGELTVNGITRPVVLDAKRNAVGGHPFYDNAPAAGFNATTTLKRSDFGMGKYVPVVSDELKVDITVEAIESSAWRKALEKRAAEAATGG